MQGIAKINLVLIWLLCLSVWLHADEIHLKKGRKIEGKIIKVSKQVVEIRILGHTGQIQKVTFPRKLVKKLIKKPSIAGSLEDKLEKLEPPSTEEYYQCALWCIKQNIKTQAVPLLNHVIHQNERLRPKACLALASIEDDLEIRYHLLKTALCYDPQNEKIKAELDKATLEYKQIQRQRKQQFLKIFDFVLLKEYYQAYPLLKKVKTAFSAWEELAPIFEQNCHHSLLNFYGMLVNSLVGKGEPCKRCAGQGFITCRKCKGRGEVTCHVCRGSKTFKKLIGHKEYKEYLCPGCSGSGTLTCPECSIKRGKEICPSCGGSGVEELAEVRSQNPICPECHGKRNILCRKCQGHNFIVCPKCRGRKEFRKVTKRNFKGELEYIYADCPGCQGRGILPCTAGAPISKCSRCGGTGRIFNLNKIPGKIEDISVNDLKKLYQDLQKLYEITAPPIQQLKPLNVPSSLPQITSWLPVEKKIVFWEGRWMSPKNKQFLTKKTIALSPSHTDLLKIKAQSLKNDDWFEYFQTTPVDFFRNAFPVYVTSFTCGQKDRKPGFTVGNRGKIQLHFSLDQSEMLDLSIVLLENLYSYQFKNRAPIDKPGVVMQLYYQSPQVNWRRSQNDSQSIITGEVTAKILAAECFYHGKLIAYLK